MPRRKPSPSTTASAQKPIVFLGPSMPREQARALLPEAEYLPPIRRGDLDALPDGSVVGMIDGVFDQHLSISPREIHNALVRGMSILGSSSMGALRAAEVRGIVGVGKIFEMYRDGELERDDEVALLFDAESYVPVTEPLVNVRYAANSLARSGTIDEEIARRILQAAQALHYRDRAWPNILRGAGLAGRSDTPRLLEMLRGIDLKRQDAQLLLEGLPSFAAAARGKTKPTGKLRSGPEQADHFRHVKLAGAYEAEAPLLIWEYGDSISFRELVRFLALTHQLLPHVRAAAARFTLQGNELKVPIPRALKGVLPSAQKLLGNLQSEWGWRTAEEATVTLRDLGLGLEDLSERLHEEEAARAKEAALATRAEKTFLKALRSELVMDELALKREALRLGAVKTLSRQGRREGPLSEAERISAQRVVARLHQKARWSAVPRELALVGVTREELDAFVEELGYARRASAPLVRSFRSGQAPREERPPALAFSLPPELPLKSSPKAPGSPRFSLPLEEADAVTRKLSTAIGITRVGQIGELDELGVHVAQAFRPGSPWSTTLGSGKSESPIGARVGGIMEELEKHCQERFSLEGREVVESFARLSQREAVVDPRTLPLPYDSRYHEELELAWTRCVDLMTGRPMYVPSAALVISLTRDDIFYSARSGRKLVDTNGLASGFTLEEALSHAISELIERHATRLADLQLENPGHCGSPRHYRFVDLDTAPEGVRRLRDKFARAGFDTRVLHITSEIRVPTFEARLLRDALFAPEDEPLLSYPGWAAHPNPEMAMTMALLEAAQTRAGNIAGAREDLTLQARSLGRHERPRPKLGSATSFWYRSDEPGLPFPRIEGLAAVDLLEELRWLLERLREAGLSHALFVDYSRPELAPARAVRVLIPGLESINPFHTGPRARATAIRDLVG